MRCGGFGNGSTTTLNIYPYLAHHQVGAGVDEEEETRVPGKIPESSLSLERTGRWTEASGIHRLPLCCSIALVHPAT